MNISESFNQNSREIHLNKTNKKISELREFIQNSEEVILFLNEISSKTIVEIQLPLCGSNKIFCEAEIYSTNRILARILDDCYIERNVSEHIQVHIDKKIRMTKIILKELEAEIDGIINKHLKIENITVQPKISDKNSESNKFALVRQDDSSSDKTNRISFEDNKINSMIDQDIFEGNLSEKNKEKLGNSDKIIADVVERFGSNGIDTVNENKPNFTTNRKNKSIFATEFNL